MAWEEEKEKEQNDRNNKESEPNGRIIVMKEMAESNSSVGTEWTEAHSFPVGTPLEDVINWASDAKGRVMIERDQAYDKEDPKQ